MTDDTKKKPARKRKAKGPLPDELIDLLLCELEGKDAESVLGSSGLAGRLKKQLAERMLAAELSHHLDTEAAAGGDQPAKPGNPRNGTSAKTVLTPNGALPLDIPRDRLSIFEPQLIAKHQRRLPGFDDHVIGMYTRGITVREIQGHLLEIYGLEVRPSSSRPYGGDGRSGAVASTATGYALSDRLLRCAAPEDPRRRHSQE